MFHTIASQRNWSRLVNNLVEDEIQNGIPPSRIVSDRNSLSSLIDASFSIADDRWFFYVSTFRHTLHSRPDWIFSNRRGGAVALYAGKISFRSNNLLVYSSLTLALTSAHCLAGVLALSTWLPLSKTFPSVSLLIWLDDHLSVSLGTGRRWWKGLSTDSPMSW